MSDKKVTSLSKFAIELVRVVMTLFKFIPNFIMLLELESQEAQKSLIALLVLYLIATTLMITTWICVLAMVYVYLTSMHISSLEALVLIVVFNLLLLVITALLMLNKKNQLAFSKTRHLLRNINKK